MKLNKWIFCKECKGKGFIIKKDEFDYPHKYKCKKCKGRGTLNINKTK